MPQLYSNLSGKSKVLLPDGSEVWMHTETSLQYGSQMNKDERIVNVTGEAYFDVAHDADKPFIVQTEGMRIVVHGTKFNVDAFPGSEKYIGEFGRRVRLFGNRDREPFPQTGRNSYF